MNSTDWSTPFLTVTPWMIWFFLGIGVPYSLWLLPRRDWRDWTMVVGTALALGPMLGTTWLFILGTVSTFEFSIALTGTLVLAGIGSFFAYRRRAEFYDDTPLPDDGYRFPLLKWVLLVMMAIGWLAMAWDTAYWPFLRYDTLWTFGYNAKIFMLYEEIPQWIDYYPNLVPLTFTWGDLAWGSHNDHAARAAVPWFFLATVFASYLLGWRVYRSRLTGLLTAGLWLLLPSSLVWASSGDLEHPMAIYFTLAAVFFILAWREKEHQTRYAILSGLTLGGAMWTKPTSGAFVLGVGMVFLWTIFKALQQRDQRYFWQRFRLMVTVGLASAPIGGMWYTRNMLAGHRWTNLPPEYWQELSQRSGMQLVWLYALAVLGTFFLLHWHWRSWQRNWHLIVPIIGLGLLSIAILPTLLSVPEGGWTNQTSWDWVNGFREPTRRFTIAEFTLLIIGALILVLDARAVWQKIEQPIQQGLSLSIGLGLPFFAVYFWSFSYHYRLALTVLPLILAALIALLVRWLIPFILRYRVRQWAVVVVVFVASWIAPLAASYHTVLNTFDEDGVRTDRDKYKYANPALMQTVAYLELHAGDSDQSFKISAPGENRLAFYFPEWEVDDATLPLTVEDLTNYDLFLPVFADFLWRTYDRLPNQVEALRNLGDVYEEIDPERTFPRVLLPLTPPIDDGNNRYVIYAVNPTAAYAEVEPEYPLDNVVYGEALQLEGFDMPVNRLEPGQPFHLIFYWRGTEQAPLLRDYTVYVHFLDPNTDELVWQMDGGIMNGIYPTRFITPNLLVRDFRISNVPADLAFDGPLQLRVGVYLPNGPRLDAIQDGQHQGDGVVIQNEIWVESN